MTTKKKIYKSEAFEAIHQAAGDLHQVGAVDRTTMRKFDESCLSDIDEMTGAEIKALRERERVSQPVFARYLNVGRNVVSDWERDVKHPSGPALRLLTIIRKHGLGHLA